MINNFQAFGNRFLLNFDIKLDTDQNVYCFIGENGVGKTKLLQTMAKSLLFSHTMFDGKKDGTKAYSAIGLDSIIHSKLKELEINLPVDVKINGISLKSEDFHTVRLDALNMNKSRLINSFPVDIPLVFISALGRGHIGALDMDGKVQLPSSIINKFISGFMTTYNSMHNLAIVSNSVTNWFLERLIVNPNLVHGVQQRHAEAVFVLECLEALAPEWKLVQKNDNGSISINLSYSNGELLINNIPIQNLSTGYASILRIIQEIVAGIGSWNENSDFKNSKAAIFIDEIDLHLHPTWQYKIVGILKLFFPKVTFYLTTHSPLVLFNLKNGESYKLNKDTNNLVTVERVQQTNMHFIADIFKEFFDVKNIGLRPVNKDAILKAQKEFLNMANHNGTNHE